MQRDERVGPQRQPLGGGEHGREGIALGPRELERGADERAQLLLGERLAGGVDGCVVGRLGRLAEVVALDLEAVAVGLPAQADARAGRQLRLEPGLVEPGRLDLAGVVGDARGEDLQPAAAAPRATCRGRRPRSRPRPRRTGPGSTARRSAARSGAAGARAGRRSCAARASRGGPARPGRRAAASRPRAASASGRGALRGRGQRGGGSWPAKPTGSTISVEAGGTGSEYRTGPGPPAGCDRRPTAAGTTGAGRGDRRVHLEARAAPVRSIVPFASNGTGVAPTWTSVSVSPAGSRSRSRSDGTFAGAVIRATSACPWRSIE